MSNDFVSPTLPAQRDVSLKNLPRGIVPPPPCVLEEVAQIKAYCRPNWNPEFEVMSLNDRTLGYYFAGIDVAYRPTDEGPEVLAVGIEEVGSFVRSASQEILDTVTITVPV